MSVATSCEGVSTESPVLGDRQIVTSFLLSINQSSSSSFLPSINSDSNAATNVAVLLLIHYYVQFL